MRDIPHHPAQVASLHKLYGEAGITPGVGKALVQLPSDHPVPMRELASALHCDNSYITSVIDILEEKGLVERHAHPSDRRIKVISLTEDGALLAKRARAKLAEPPPAFDSLTDTEATQLRDLMRKLGD
jgi:DNA-binding MarR family transcriptional regulator